MRSTYISKVDFDLWTVIKNDFPEIQRLEVINAWAFSNFLRLLRSQGYSEYSNPKQVFLAEPPPAPTNSKGQDGSRRKAKPRYETYLYTRILGYDDWQQLWGTEVECLRLDNIDFKMMTVNSINDPSAGLQNLKIMILNGKSQHNSEGWVWTLDPDWKPNGIVGQAVPADGSIPEIEVVRAIAGQGLDKLRMIIVNGYHFWIRVCTSLSLSLPCLMSFAACHGDRPVLLADPIAQSLSPPDRRSELLTARVCSVHTIFQEMRGRSCSRRRLYQCRRPCVISIARRRSERL